MSSLVKGFFFSNKLITKVCFEYLKISNDSEIFRVSPEMDVMFVDFEEEMVLKVTGG